MLTPEEIRFALDDARHRQEALLELIYSIERQAGTLLRLYITLALAAASASGALLFGTAKIPGEVGAGLLGAVAVLLTGSWFCMRAMKSAAVALPGRGADFWLTALDPNIEFNEVANRILKELSEKQERDRKLNEKTASALEWAKEIGVSTPIAAVVSALAAHLVS